MAARSRGDGCVPHRRAGRSDCSRRRLPVPRTREPDHWPGSRHAADDGPAVAEPRAVSGGLLRTPHPHRSLGEVAEGLAVRIFSGRRATRRRGRSVRTGVAGFACRLAGDGRAMAETIFDQRGPRASAAGRRGRDRGRSGRASGDARQISAPGGAGVQAVRRQALRSLRPDGVAVERLRTELLRARTFGRERSTRGLLQRREIRIPARRSLPWIRPCVERHVQDAGHHVDREPQHGTAGLDAVGVRRTHHVLGGVCWMRVPASPAGRMRCAVGSPPHRHSPIVLACNGERCKTRPIRSSSSTATISSFPRVGAKPGRTGNSTPSTRTCRANWSGSTSTR